MSRSSAITTRIAPSPTGYLHVGTARTALFNYLFAKHHSGTFLLRIEDTDRERSRPEFEEPILEGLAWLGIVPDAEYRQSEHIARHTECLRTLVEHDTAYVSREPSKNDPSLEVEVVRLRNPGKKVTFTDLIRGEVTFDTTELGDFVIARSMTDPLYHLAVVIDDYDEAVSHVIRAEEHLSNTPRQILLHEALGFEVPTYAHIPLILAPDRSKLSKRKGAVSLTEFRDNGYLPDALRNYLALLGWNPGTDREKLSMEELVAQFDLAQVQKGGAIFDTEKLNWLNREYLKELSEVELLEKVRAQTSAHDRLLAVFGRHPEALRDAIDRYDTLGAFALALDEGEYDFYVAFPEYEPDALLWKKDPSVEDAQRHITHVRSTLATLADEQSNPTTLKELLWDYATAEGRGNVLWPVRYALSGREKSPDPFLLAATLGREESVRRLDHALSLLHGTKK